MPSNATCAGRVQRIIDVFTAGRSIPEIALAEEIGREWGIARPRNGQQKEFNADTGQRDTEWRLT